jgi:DNA-binding response OmpR family regulator
MGASAYLTKPLSVRDFLHTVDTLLTTPQPAAAAEDSAQASLAAAQPGDHQSAEYQPEEYQAGQPRSGEAGRPPPSA